MVIKINKVNKKERNEFNKAKMPLIYQMIKHENSQNVYLGLSMLRQLDYKGLLSFLIGYDSGCKYENQVIYKGHVIMTINIKTKFVVIIFHGDDYKDLWSTHFPFEYKEADKKYKFIVWKQIFGRDKTILNKKKDIFHMAIDMFINKIDSNEDTL